VTGAGFQYLSPPHSLLLGVIAAAGALGLTGLVIVVASLGWQLAVRARDDPLTVAVLAGALAVYSSSWVVNHPWDRWLWLPIALVAGGIGHEAADSPPAAPLARSAG
jgi:hypothetical protein